MRIRLSLESPDFRGLAISPNSCEFGYARAVFEKSWGFWLAGPMEYGLWNLRRGHKSASYAVEPMLAAFGNVFDAASIDNAIEAPLDGDAGLSLGSAKGTQCRKSPHPATFSRSWEKAYERRLRYGNATKKNGLL